MVIKTKDSQDLMANRPTTTSDETEMYHQQVIEQFGDKKQALNIPENGFQVTMDVSAKTKMSAEVSQTTPMLQNDLYPNTGKMENMFQTRNDGMNGKSAHEPLKKVTIGNSRKKVHVTEYETNVHYTQHQSGENGKTANNQINQISERHGSESLQGDAIGRFASRTPNSANDENGNHPVKSTLTEESAYREFDKSEDRAFNKFDDPSHDKESNSIENNVQYTKDADGHSSVRTVQENSGGVIGDNEQFSNTDAYVDIHDHTGENARANGRDNTIGKYNINEVYGDGHDQAGSVVSYGSQDQSSDSIHDRTDVTLDQTNDATHGQTDDAIHEHTNDATHDYTNVIMNDRHDSERNDENTKHDFGERYVDIHSTDHTNEQPRENPQPQEQHYTSTKQLDDIAEDNENTKQMEVYGDTYNRKSENNPDSSKEQSSENTQPQKQHDTLTKYLRESKDNTKQKLDDTYVETHLPFEDTADQTNVHDNLALLHQQGFEGTNMLDQLHHEEHDIPNDEHDDAIQKPRLRGTQLLNTIQNHEAQLDQLNLHAPMEQNGKEFQLRVAKSTNEDDVPLFYSVSYPLVVVAIAMYTLYKYRSLILSYYRKNGAKYKKVPTMIETKNMRKNPMERDVLSGLKPFIPNQCNFPEGFVSVINIPTIEKITKFLPETLRVKDWSLLYASDAHGYNLHTAYRNCTDRGPFMFVVMDSNRNVFGGFSSTSLSKRAGYYGNGESFVGKFSPEFEIFQWTGANNHIIISNDSMIAFGSDGGFALWLDETFEKGTSGTCKTFDNKCLASGEHFRVVAVEIWGFQNPHLHYESSNDVRGRNKYTGFSASSFSKGFVPSLKR